MKIFGVTIILSPKMLQEGFAPMQINDSTYNLRTGSIHYVNMVGFLPGLKRVYELPSDHLS